MGSRKPSIPAAPKGDRFLAAVKENLEIIRGQRDGEIAMLKDNATTGEIIAKINEILARLQG